MEKHPLHIKHPDLQTSEEVQRSVELQEHRTGERVPNDPAARLEAYASRLERIFLHPDAGKRERNLDMLRSKIYDALIIKRENFPESYFELQQRVARERGQPIENIPPGARDRMIEVAIQDQKASLDAWINYLTSSDAKYPAWFKYFVWRNITKLSQFDKERGEFKKRTDSTVAPFPDIHSDALAKILDLYLKVKADNKQLKDPEIREQFGKKFPDLYAELISQSLAAKLEGREETRGQWVSYSQNTPGEAERLFASLADKGTGWCTAGQETAKIQIQSGDFHVYYTNDTDGNPRKPRLAIRMEGKGKIAEVRGILPHQGVEPVMQGVLDAKLATFGSEADAYKKKSADMKRMTALEGKREQGQPLTRDDLIFLYEINAPIEGFGYERDPRIAELRKDRNVEDDMLTIFNCTKGEIAHVPSEINPATKAYVGQLEPGIFQKLPAQLEHIYTSFPDKKIRRETVEIGGKSAKELLRELEAAGIKISGYAKFMLQSREFVAGKKPEEATLIRLTVADLGFKTGATTDQIYERAQALGLDLCPADTGPNYRLKYKNQPLGEWINVGMKQISDPDRNPRVFDLVRSGVGLWLRHAWAEPGWRWGPGDLFVFRLRK